MKSFTQSAEGPKEAWMPEGHGLNLQAPRSEKMMGEAQVKCAARPAAAASLRRHLWSFGALGETTTVAPMTIRVEAKSRRIGLAAAFVALAGASGGCADQASNYQAVQADIENKQRPGECSDCGPPTLDNQGRIIPQG